MPSPQSIKTEDSVIRENKGRPVNTNLMQKQCF